MTAREPKNEEVEVRRYALATGVLVIAALLVFAAVALARFAVGHSVVLPLHLPVWVAFIGLLAAGMTPLLLEVRANTFSISLTEIPIVVCLISMQRTPMLVAGTLGCAAAILWKRQRAALKLVFNVAVTLFEMAVAAAVFDSLVGVPTLTGWTTWLALVAATAAAAALSSIPVNLVINLAGDPITVRQSLRHSMLGIANAATATMLTLLTLATLSLTAMAVIPLGFIAVVSILPLRRHAKLKRRYDGLLLLHEFTAGLTGSTDLDSTLSSVLRETCRVLRSNGASIVLPRDGDQFFLTLDDREVLPVIGDPVWRAVMEDGRPVCLPRGSDAYGGYLDTHGLRDLMAVPLVHGDNVVGALIARDRLGETSTFDDDDLSIFGTMANQTTVTLENLRLIGRLRDESAEREHQALHDELTGLPNRAHLYSILESRLKEGPLAVAMLDLNRFKEVNDTLGHHAGDEVLVQTARRLRHALPSSALVARLGGDEFGIVLFGVSKVSDAVARLASLEVAFNEPIELESMTLRVDASIGVAMSPEHGTDRGSLLRRADVAMYAAKQIRGTTVRSYEKSQERSSKRSLEIVGELRKAIEEERLDVAFQPKAALATGEIVGAEALARWTHPTLGRIPPDEFIPLAEQSGLIHGLTTFILRRSLAACADWRREGFSLNIAVNIEAQTLLGADFVENTLAELNAWGIPPTELTLEITERELVRELDAATLAIERLRATGISLSIDDFGTGYSSLAYLSRLPVDEVKIDRAFVMHVTQSPIHEAIIRAISDISGKLGATTVVEGIEDEASWNVIASLGCTHAQGYHLARPMPEVEFLAWLHERAVTHPFGPGSRHLKLAAS
jgi:diguanylate cyclase (GGDEF)-like protein